MRFFLYVSVFLLSCLSWQSCDSQSLTAGQMNRMPHISDSTKMYSANFTVLKYHFTGLIYFIKQNDSTVRAIMTSEMGPKILDLNLMPQKYNVNFAIRQMKRKVVLNTLYYDLGVASGLFTSKAPTSVESTDSVTIARYKLTKKKELLYSLSNVPTEASVAYIYEKKKEVVKIDFFYKPVSNNIDSISISHQTVRMNIELKKIKL